MDDVNRMILMEQQIDEIRGANNDSIKRRSLQRQRAIMASVK